MINDNDTAAKYILSLFIESHVDVKPSLQPALFVLLSRYCKLCFRLNYRYLMPPQPGMFTLPYAPVHKSRTANGSLTDPHDTNIAFHGSSLASSSRHG